MKDKLITLLSVISVISLGIIFAMIYLLIWDNHEPLKEIWYIKVGLTAMINVIILTQIIRVIK